MTGPLVTGPHVDPGETRSGPAATRRRLAGWGGRPAVVASVVDAADLDAAWDLPEAARGVVARGRGRSYGDAAQRAGGVVVDMTSANRIHLDVDEGRVDMDAGVELADLLDASLPHGWALPVTPGTRRVTVGGAIANDVHGKNHPADSTFGAWLERVDLRLPSGEIRRLEPPDAELRATTGGVGLTGVVLAARLRLRRVEAGWVLQDTMRTDDLDATLAVLTDAVAAGRGRHHVAWVDVLGLGGAPGRSVVTVGDDAPAEAVPAGVDPLAPLPTPRLTAPSWLPPGLLGRRRIAVANAVKWHRAPRSETARPVRLDAFTYPLDVVDEWSRAYGVRGLVQHQMAVPAGAEHVLRATLARCVAARVPVLLAVLKPLGPGRGLLSFPIEGWTLALDVPAHVDGLADLLDDVDADVAAAGGRVYLAKDARLRPDLLPAMYPELDTWREIRERLDPDRRIRSDLSLRLGL